MSYFVLLFIQNISPFLTGIIHHNQLLLTKSGKNFAILIQWRQKCKKGKTWGRRCLIFGEQKSKKLIFSFKSLKIFWINNQAIISASLDNTLLDLQNSSFPTKDDKLNKLSHLVQVHIDKVLFFGLKELGNGLRVLIFSNLNHPCSLVVYYNLFRVFQELLTRRIHTPQVRFAPTRSRFAPTQNRFAPTLKSFR